MRIPLLILFIFLTTPFTASAITIGGGSPGGAYARYASNLGNLLTGQGIIDDADVENYGGAQGNLKALQDDADVAFVQGDTYAAASSTLPIIGVIGEECVFIAYKKGGKVTDEDDLQKEKLQATIAVGARGSGSQVSWGYMTQLENGYKATAAQYTGGARAMAALSTGAIDAVLWVTDPTTAMNHKLVKAVAGNKQLKLMDVDDKDLNDDLPTGEPVYVFRKVKLGKAGKVKVPCTPLLVVTSNDLDDNIVEAVATILLTNAAGILR